MTRRPNFFLWLCGLCVIGGLLTTGCASNKSHTIAPLRSSTPLTRNYVEGETARYVMIGVNQGREHTINYTAEAESRVLRDEQGRFVEEFRWTRVNLAGQDVPLDETSTRFRQRVSLDPDVEMSPPDITGLNPLLIGPVFDLMTFYVDLHPSLHQGKLKAAGDRTRVGHGTPNSWADGTNVIIGEDCIDFELTLNEVNEHRAMLNVRHVPPERTSVKLPAEWMHERVNPATPNNWVQVQQSAGTGANETPFVAAAGHETFDVVLEIERPSGRILTATMDNPVRVRQRRCKDRTLMHCEEPETYQIRRVIELRRVP